MILHVTLASFLDLAGLYAKEFDGKLVKLMIIDTAKLRKSEN